LLQLWQEFPYVPILRARKCSFLSLIGRNCRIQQKKRSRRLLGSAVMGNDD